MTDLTDIEIGVLKLVNSYGVDLDLSAPRISRTIKAAGRELLRKGYLTGTMKAVSLTVRASAVVGSVQQP
jgi:hypothetical protein